ncbi:hypothetical protein IWW54_006528 [Coemansia sp. RSA 2705]|nr:hypothetical protein IWW54_006528 [Coemansia sp. RSA 2705]
MSFFVGLAAAVLGNVVIGAGQCLQKYALNRLQRDWDAQQAALLETGSSTGRSQAVAYASAIDMRARGASVSRGAPAGGGHVAAARGPRARYTSKLWVLGLALNYAGEACGNAVALSYLSAAVVAPIGIVAVLVNVVLAERLLGERVSSNQRFGFSVIVAGVACILLVAPRGAGADDATGFVRMVQASGLVRVFCALYAVQALLVWVLRTGRQSLYLYVAVAAVFGTMSVMVSKLMTMYLRLRLAFAALPNPADVAVYGAGAAVGARAVTLPRVLLVLAMCVSVVGQESFRQQALGRYPVMQFQPVFFAAYNVVATLTGLVLFRELRGWAHALVFFSAFSLGIALIAYGSRFLQKARSVGLPSHIKLHKENLLKSQ